MKIASPLAALLLMTACARDDTAYPSLSVRAAEARGFAEPAVAPPAPVTADPALDVRLAAFGSRLDALAKGFDNDAARATRLAGVTGARTVGGEAWIAAQTALAALDDWRAQAGGLAAEIDAVVRERVETVGTPYPTLDALRDQAEGEAAREATAIAAIGARLPTP